MRSSIRPILAILCAIFLSSFAHSTPVKNRIVIAEGDIIKLFEFNTETSIFDLIWESAETGTGIKSRTSGIVGITLEDLDGDGKNELLAIDQFGIFIWGNTGKIPQYYNLKNAVSQRNTSYIVPIKLDEDGGYEFVIQRSFNFRKRKIEAFKLDGLNLINIAEIELPGGLSWSLRTGDCDNDEKEDIITSAEFIHVLGWKEANGFIEKARFSHNSNLVDMVRIADIDGDGNNEILASGNSGCFTVYSIRKSRKTGEITYPVIFHSEDLEGYTQGLETADLDGDGKKEILIGVTDKVKRGGPKENNNIVIFELKEAYISPGGMAKLSLEKALAMPLESSSIPGFAAGDIDGDGKDEAVFNNKYVLDFKRNDEGHFEAEILTTFAVHGSACVIGQFEPEGNDQPTSKRIIPQNFCIGLNRGDMIESGNSYKLWTKVISPWNAAKNVIIRLESETENIEIKNDEFALSQMEAGTVYDNSEFPFMVFVGDITADKDFRLKLLITTEDGYLLSQSYNQARSMDGANLIFNAVPKFNVNSNTLIISSGKDSFGDLNISYDYYDENFGMKGWPKKEILLKYANIIDQTPWGLLLIKQKDNLQSYLENGGNALVHGYKVLSIRSRNIDAKNRLQDFVRKYFKCNTDRVYKGKKELFGKPSDPISDKMSFQLQDNEESELPDIIDVEAGADPILYYSSGEVAGIRIDGKYKMIYLGFSLEDIIPVDAKQELVKRILAWFDSK